MPEITLNLNSTKQEIIMMKQSKKLSILLMLLVTTVSLAVPTDWRKGLPEPIIEQHPEWIEMYYATWQMADKKKMKHGGEFIFDTAFDAGRVWLWDTVWISHFGIYCQNAHPRVIKPMFGHDLFYSAQKPDGAIPHVYNRNLTKHEYTMHNPIFTLGELNYYRHTGDKSRLKRVLPILDRFYFNLKQRFADPEKFVYRSFDWSNGMDNRPRGYFTIDSTAEQVMVAKQLVEISKLVGDTERAKKFEKEFKVLEQAINDQMWSKKDQFYVDLTKDYKQENHWSVASYWPFLAGLPNQRQAKAMVKHLFDPKNFKTPFMVPTLGRKSKGYDGTGGHYWRGSVWVPTNAMVIKGLAQYGFHKEAFDIAVNGLDGIYKTWKRNKTFWENYDQEKPGKRGENSRKDFIGWTEVQPISLLIENIIGINTNAPRNRIDWHIQLAEKHGIKNLKWGKKYSKEVDLVCTPSPTTDEYILSVRTNSPFKLQVFHSGRRLLFDLPKAGNRTFRINTSQKFITKNKRGIYFNKKKYTPEPLPTFDQVKSQLPSPILEDNNEWQKMYWKCWEIAFSKLRAPEPNSPMVSNWMDEAFSKNIFQWDTIFMMMFARYGHSQFPAIQSLDNFYALQRPSGYICREYREIDGKEVHFDHANAIAPIGLFSPTGWRNTINPPLFSWAELESFKVSGDKSRFEEVYQF